MEIATASIKIANSDPPIELPISPELLGELAEKWSEPVQVRAYKSAGRWELAFRRVPNDNR